jgi:hypothetical protein
MQKRLRAIGLRPISALVDITNYLTMDRGRPLHVFDAGKVTGDIHVRLSRPGETLEALNDKTYSFDDAMTLICDDAGPEAIGGVMGGLHSGCTAETVDVFVEAAYFDPVRTAATGRKLRINSDARYRFERGVDPEFTPVGMELGTRMILEFCGGEASEVVVAGEMPDTSRSYALDPDRVVSLVGMEISREEQIRILAALGFEVTDPIEDDRGCSVGLAAALAPGCAGRGGSGRGDCPGRLAEQAGGPAPAAHPFRGQRTDADANAKAREPGAPPVGGIGAERDCQLLLRFRNRGRAVRRRSSGAEVGESDLVRDVGHAAQPAAGAAGGCGASPIWACSRLDPPFTVANPVSRACRPAPCV